jgi:hypothetical protein
VTMLQPAANEPALTPNQQAIRAAA